METKVHCPKCGSDQITANQHGYSAGKAAAGAVLTGGVGLLAGMHGSKKIDITCLACGFKFKPGEGSQTATVNPNASSAPKPIDHTAGAILLIITVIIGSIILMIFL